MKINVVRIGNSRGIRIPKAVLASVYELQCGVGTERWIDEDFSSVGCIA